MINKTINSVIAALYKEFGDSYKYEVEDNEQNLTTPCFTIGFVMPTTKGGLWTIRNRLMPVVVHYFPKDELRPNRECYSVAERALEALEVIEIDGVKVAGKQLETQVIEGVLQVFATYEFWTETPVQTDPIEEIEHHTSLE